MKCLLVDDSASMLELMQHHLKQCEIDDLEVATANNGQSALELYESFQPDVVLLDYVMTDMSGLEVLKRLGGKERSLPVVMVTSFNDVEAIVDTLDCGAQGYLLKDRLSSGALQLAIQEAIQKHQMQLDLRFQTQELERFTRTVAHDLKDHISGVYGVLNYLAENSNEFNDTQQRMVKTGRDSARKMQDFVNDLLAYSLAGIVSANLENISLKDALDEAKNILSKQIDDSGSVINQPSELPRVMGVKGLIVQLFQNIISNAIKYKSDAPLQITIKATDEDRFWKISIADNGKGIAAPHIGRVFNAFENGEANKAIEGVGVGLATCRRIVEDLHHGKIWVESSEGSGATFFFTLPK